MMYKLLRTIISGLRSQKALALENLPLRQQLAILSQTMKRPRLTKADRLFWVFLSSSKYMVRHGKPPCQTWKTFLRNPMGDMVSMISNLGGPSIAHSELSLRPFVRHLPCVGWIFQEPQSTCSKGRNVSFKIRF